MPYTGMVQIPTINTTLTGDVDRPAGLNYLYQTACESEIGVSEDDRTITISTATPTMAKIQGSPTAPCHNFAYSPGQQPARSDCAGQGDIGISDFSEIPDDPTDPGASPGYSGPLGLPLDVEYQSTVSAGWTVDGLTYKWSENETSANEGGTLGYNWLGTSFSSEPNPLTVTYTGALLMLNGTLAHPGNTEKVAAPPATEASDSDASVVKLTLKDGTGSDGATGTGTFYMHVHRAVEDIKAPNQPGQTDELYYVFKNIPAVWWGGQPTDTTTVNNIVGVVYAYLWRAVGVAGDAAEVLSSDIKNPTAAAVAELAGVALNELANAETQQHGANLYDLWPGNLPDRDSYKGVWRYPNQWAQNNRPTDKPVEYPTNGSPSAIGASSKLPCDVPLNVNLTCTPYLRAEYQDELFEQDNWGSSGYQGCSYQWFEYGPVVQPIGVWSYTIDSESPQ